jgi:hypothetical protein
MVHQPFEITDGISPGTFNRTHGAADSFPIRNAGKHFSSVMH